MKTRWSIERRVHVLPDPLPISEYWNGEEWVEECEKDFTDDCEFFTEPPDAVAVTGDEDARVVEWQISDDQFMVRIS